MNTKESIEYLNSIEFANDFDTEKNQLKLVEIGDKLLELDEIKEDLRDFDLEIKELKDVIKPGKLINDMKIIINKYIKKR